MAAATAADSVVDLDYCRKLPKIELHAHLSGSISRECLHEIWLRKKEAEPTLELTDPLHAMPKGKVDFDLETFFPLFSSYIYNLCDDLPSIVYSTQSVLEDFAADNVVYLELRTTPRAIPAADISLEAYVTTILDCMADFTATSQDVVNRGMHTKLVLSIDRRHDLAKALQIVDLAVGYQSQGVVGVDLCGDPTTGDVSLFTPAFRRAKAAGLKITVHFGEVETVGTVREEELTTILSWDPNRLGHVIHVPEPMGRDIIERGIGVELCLSCNVHAKMIRGSFDAHHFGWWWEHTQGRGIALSTDDVGVFCSPLSQEYFLAAQHFKLDRGNLKQLCLGALETIFGDDAEKKRLADIYSTGMV